MALAEIFLTDMQNAIKSSILDHVIWLKLEIFKSVIANFSLEFTLG